MSQQCAYCTKESDELHRDHVVPRSRGGPDNAKNIVLACQPCNSSKRDKTATEWLGDRCPTWIAEIEDAVNRAIERSFAKRDAKKSKPKGQDIFAYNINDEGGAEYIGQVVSETDDRIRMLVIDALMATGCGMWILTDCLKDVPKARCELFIDNIACLESALRRNGRIYNNRKLMETAL